MSMSLSRTQQLEAYRRMLRIRKFEEEGTRLYKAGKIPGAYHASIGQEAAIVGACMALRDDDTSPARIARTAIPSARARSSMP